MDVATDAAVAPPATEVIAEAAQVASSLNGGRGGTVRLGNGVVLKLRPVAPLAIREAAIRGNPPQIPIVHLADKDRDEPNPNDPDYLRANQEYAARQLFQVSDVLMLMGSEFVSAPDDVFPPTSDEWADMLRSTGMEIDTSNKYTRYLSWLRLYALTSEGELSQVLAGVVRLSGVTEVEVQRAAAAFLRYA
jgi:hypothetical protein